MNLYDTLPPTPEKLSSASILVRLVDGIGFRYRVATEGLTENEFHFRCVESSMSIFEVNKHIFQLIRWVTGHFDPDFKYRKSTESFDDYRNGILEICWHLRNKLLTMSDLEIEKTTVYLKRADKHFPVYFLINGPLADALTHVGQINTWRRIAGNPVPRISPFTGEGY